MATKNETVEISYKANINQLIEKLKTIPNVTAAEAKKMATALDRQLKQTERAAKRASETSKKAAEASSAAARRGSKDFNKFAKSAGMAAGQFLAMGAGVLAFSQKIADLTNELSDASTKSGIAIETLAGLRLAAEGSGLEFSKLESGLVKFSKSMVDSETGSKKLESAFGNLGVKVKDSDGNFRKTNDTFNDVMKSLSQMEAGAERNAIVMEIFGRTAGPGLIQSGALDNLAAMTAMAKEFGVAIDEDGVQSMANFQRAMAEFDLVSQGTLERLLNSITGEGGGLASGIEMASSAMVFFGSIGAGVIDSYRLGFEAVSLQIQAMIALTSGDIKLASFLSAEGIDKALEGAKTYSNLLGDAVDDVTRFNELSAITRNIEKEISETLKEELETEEKIEKNKKAREKAEKEALEALKLQQKILAAEESLLRKIEDSLLSAAKIRGDTAADDIKRIEYNAELELASINRKLADELASIAKLEQAAGNSFQADIAREEAKTDAKQKRKDLELDSAEEIEAVKKADHEATKKRADDLEATNIANFDANSKRAGEAAAQRLEEDLAILSATQDLFSASNDLIDQNTKQLQESAQKEIDSIKARYEEGEKMSKQDIILIREKQQAIKDAAMKSFGLSQAEGLINIGISTATGVAAAMAKYPGPIGIGLAGVMVATGAVQAAAVISQSPPSYHMGGMIPGETGITALAGEAVLDRATVNSLGGEEGVRDLQNQSNPQEEITVRLPYKHFDRWARGNSRSQQPRAGSNSY